MGGWASVGSLVVTVGYHGSRLTARVECPRQPDCLFAPCVPPFRLTSGGLEVDGGGYAVVVVVGCARSVSIV